MKTKTVPHIPKKITNHRLKTTAPDPITWYIFLKIGADTKLLFNQVG